MVVVVAAETARAAEAEVGVGEMVQPRTPPTKTDRKIETDRTEVGRRRNLMGWDPPCGQPTAPTGEAGASHRALTEGMIFGDGNLRAVSQRRPQEKLRPAIGRLQRDD